MQPLGEGMHFCNTCHCSARDKLAPLLSRLVAFFHLFCQRHSFSLCQEASKMASAASTSTSSSSDSQLYAWVWFGVAVYMIGQQFVASYKIRMNAIEEFGPVIHEFDPYFNFRATEVSPCLNVCGSVFTSQCDSSLLYYFCEQS